MRKVLFRLACVAQNSLFLKADKLGPHVKVRNFKKLINKYLLTNYYIEMQEGKRKSDTPALWWIDSEGNEVKWCFQDVAFWSKK